MRAAKSENSSDAISHLLEECRMVLPGIQALFGFQLIAVFNQRFDTIPEYDQIAHYAATGLIALSAGLVMTPAAFHREVEPSAVSKTLLDVSTRLVLASTLGIAIDFYIIGKMITHKALVGGVAAAVLVMLLAFLWIIFPYYKSKQSG